MYDFLILGVLGVTVFYGVISRHRFSKKTEAVIYALTAAFYIFRFHQGHDISSYKQIYDIAGPALFDSVHTHLMRNLLFSRLAYFSKVLFGEFRWMVLVINLTVSGLVCYTVMKHSRNILMSMMLFISAGFLEVYYGSGLRQALAMAVLLFAFYEFLPKKKYLLFEIFCLIGFGFHDIALAAVPVPLIMKLVPYFKKKPAKLLGIMLGISALAFIAVDRLGEPLGWWIGNTFGYAPTWTHVVVYLRFKEFSLLGFGMECVFAAGMAILFALSDRSQYTDFTYFEVLVFFFSIFLYIAFADYSLMSRIADYIQVIMLVLIPNLLEMIPQVKRKAAVLSALSALCVLLLYSDLNAKIGALNEQTGQSYRIADFPYVPLSDKETIDRYITLISQ